MSRALIILLLGLVGCDTEQTLSIDDSIQTAYVSIARTWQEVCADRFNKYDFPDAIELDMMQAECRRKFASGEEVLAIPELPTSDQDLVNSFGETIL